MCLASLRGSLRNVRGSATRILEANVLAASCSRVCPVEVLCEGSCVMHHYNRKPIEIGQLQRFAMESFYASGARIPARGVPERTEKIACIGAGPASLACAAELRLQGFQVTVIDRRPLPGGLNTYGVAEYKLRAADSLQEIEMIRGLGVEFRVGEIEGEASLTELEREFDCIFLGVGLGRCTGWIFQEAITRVWWMHWNSLRLIRPVSLCRMPREWS